MIGWMYLFILADVVFLTSQLFRIIDVIDQPRR